MARPLPFIERQQRRWQRGDGKLEGESCKKLIVQERKKHGFLLDPYKQIGTSGIGSKDNG